MSMEQRLRNLEVIAQISTELALMHGESLRRVEEQQRRMEEQQREMEERQRRRDELLDQLLQLVAVMQADIVRIDETRDHNEDE